MILPYFWKNNTLWISREAPELGYEKACPVAAAHRWPEYTDFLIVRGVQLWGYPKIDGYMPVFLEELKGDETILFP